MIASTTLQLKILKTKKRLFEDAWNARILLILVLGLMVILSFCLRATILSGVFGVIISEIPVLHYPIADPTKHDFTETPNAWIKKTTPVVVITDEQMYFGDLEAFSTRFADVRGKFSIKHADGAPDIPELLATMIKWEHQRASGKQEIDNNGVLVLLPSEEIPMPIVIQVIAGLKTSPLYQRIVLANGFL